MKSLNLFPCLFLVATVTRLKASAFLVPVRSQDAAPFRNGRPTTRHLSNNGFNFFRDFLNLSPDDKGEKKDISMSETTDMADTLCLARIPVVSLKKGGLRLFLLFYLMGLQNTPEKGSWKINQPSHRPYLFQFLFHDQSAFLSLELYDQEIVINRVGSSASTNYMMQESVVVLDFLGELEQMASDDSRLEEDRLLILEEPKDAIARARESVAFG